MDRHHFTYRREPDWPPLAWLAKCRRSDGDIQVSHGSRVEIHDEWFCEAVWDGVFEAADFDRTDVVFGSGARAREDSVIFVSAGTTLDRLHVLELAEEVFVSNSLLAVLAVSGAEIDPGYAFYYDDLESITAGLHDYRPEISTSLGPVRLIYYRNLSWSGSGFSTVDKPLRTRDFSSFQAYRAFLSSSLLALAVNMSDGARRHPFQMLSTLSSGYDSPTVSALAAEVGLEEAVAFESARSGRPDSGEVAAKALGLRLTVFDRDAWQSMDLGHALFPETPFLAADASGEDVFFAGAAAKLAGRVLLTGYSGDGLWEMDVSEFSDCLARRDRSGLSLTEYRLWTGFIHCPVPFLGLRQSAEVNAISRSPEMKPWIVRTGRYSRPICRRIVEEAGVPRSAFGQRKEATSVMLRERKRNWSPAARRNYAEWLSRTIDTELTGPLPVRMKAAALVVDPAYTIARMTRFALVRVGGRVLPHTGGLGGTLRVWGRDRVTLPLARFARREYTFRYAFPWAVSLAIGRYRPDAAKGRSNSGSD